MKPGLNAARILVTRPAAQADTLCQSIEQRGGVALRFPTLEIEAVAPEAGKLQQALASDWLIFTSTNAVDFALKGFGGKMPGWQWPGIAAVGQATANALRRAGLPVDCVPASEFNSEGLLAEAKMHDVDGKSCVIVRGEGGREKLAETLRSRGARVDYLEVYRRRRPDIDNTMLVEALREGRLSVATVTSVESLQNLLAMLDSDSARILRTVPLLVVSDRIEQVADQLGFNRVVVSQQPTDAAILETLTTLLNGENSGRSN